MGDPKDISGNPPTGIGTDWKVSSRPANWSEIGRRWGVTRQRVVAIHDRMMLRLGDLLLEDPYIRDWLDENDFDIEKLDRAKLRRGTPRTGKTSSGRSGDL